MMMIIFFPFKYKVKRTISYSENFSPHLCYCCRQFFFFLLKLLSFFIIIRLFFGHRRFNHGPSCILILVFVNRGCVIFHRTREEVKWYETGAFRIGHYRTFHRPINVNVIYGLAHFFFFAVSSLISSRASVAWIVLALSGEKLSRSSRRVTLKR